MSAAWAFAIGFLILVGITVLFPGFPPARILFEYLRITPPTLVSGISIASILNGVVNGFFWMFIASAIYGGVRYNIERKELQPMPAAPHLETPPPEPMVVDERVNKIPPSLTVPPIPIRSFAFSSTKVSSVEHRAIHSGAEPDIETIEGIGSVYGGLLRQSGVFTVNDLLRVGAREGGRRQLAGKVGVTYSTLLRWIYRGDLLRVRGVGRKYATLLESAGVNTVDDLSTRNPRYLCQTLRAVNKERNLVRRTPPSEAIEAWVNHARKLKPIVE